MHPVIPSNCPYEWHTSGAPEQTASYPEYIQRPFTVYLVVPVYHVAVDASLCVFFSLCVCVCVCTCCVCVNAVDTVN